MEKYLHCGEFPPEKPRYTITEEVEHTARAMKETIGRMLKLEGRLKHDFEDLARTITSDNVLFKTTMRESWELFSTEVKNEIAVFESETNAMLELFKTDLEGNYSGLSEEVKTMIANFSKELRDEYDSFESAVNSRLDAFNENNAGALADFQRHVTTEINTFEVTINTSIATFTESINERISTFEHTWEGIIEDRLNAQDGRISDAEMYMKTNLTATATTLIGDMADAGEFAEILEGEVLNNVHNKLSGILNLKNAGVSNAGTVDVSDMINTFIEEAKDGDTLYLPEGVYKIESPIVIDKNINFICEGTLKATVNAIEFSASFSKLYVKRIEGLGTNYGLFIGDNKYMEHSSIEVGVITNFENCIYIENANGTQYFDINFKQLRDSLVGVCLRLPSSSNGWISENTFKGGRIKCETAIEICNDSANNSINNNKFYNCAVEGCNNAFKMVNSYANIFKDFRYEEGENEIVKFIEADILSRENVFESTSSRLNIDVVDDEGSNTYKIGLMKGANGRFMGSGMTTHNGDKFIDYKVGDVSAVAMSYYNVNGNTADVVERIELIRTGVEQTVNPVVITLDSRYGMNCGFNDILVNITYVITDGTIEIHDSKGNNILKDVDVSAGVYLLKWVAWNGSDGKWEVFKLS